MAACAAAQTPANVQSAYSLRNQGLARVESRQLEEARALFQDLADLYPGEALAHANLGLVALRGGDAGRALSLVLKARELAPARPDIALLEVNVLEALDRLDDALAAADKALARSPGNGKLLYAKASILEAFRDKSREPEILAAWNALRARDPENIFPILEILVLAPKLDDWDAVRDACAGLRATYYQPPDSVEKALAILEEAAAGDAAAARKAKTRGLVIRNVLRATRRFKRDAEAYRLPASLGGGEEIVEFALPELLAAKEALAAANPIDLLRSAPFRAEAPNLLASIPAMSGDLDADGFPETVAWAGGERPAPLVFRRAKAAGAWTFRPSPVIQLPTAKGYSVAWSALADLDNDQDQDILGLVREEGKPAALWVYSNDAKGGFESAFGAAHEFAGGEVADVLLLGDFDHEGDLDLLFFQENAEGRWAPRLLANNLDGTYAERELRAESLKSVPLAAVALDFDNDVALDFAVQTATGVFAYGNTLDGGFPTLFKAPLKSEAGRAGLADFQHDGGVDAAVSGGGLSALLNRGGEIALALETLEGGAGDRSFALGDFDNDGWTDAAAEDGSGGLKLYLNQAGKAMRADAGNAFAGAGTPSAADLDADGDLDLVSFAKGGGAVLFHQNKGGNANRWLTVKLRGSTANDQKNNYFGLGSSIEVKAGPHLQRTYVQGDFAHFGLGQRAKADVVRVVWTNGSPQAVFSPQANAPIDVEQVILGSCPSLYCWDGEKFEFATDVLWRSALGMFIMKDIYGHAETSDDYFLVPGEALVPRGGRLEARFVMDFWEVAYVDKIRLLAVDHPAGTDLRVNEACLAPPYPEFKLYLAKERIGLAAATDSNGADHREALASRDKAYVENFGFTPYQGISTGSELILSAERWPASPDEPFHLFLNGWLYPTDASVNVALQQNSQFTPNPPLVEARGADGVWHEVARPGFPAGKYKTIPIELTGKLPADVEAVRVSTNFLIYWDEAFFAGDCDASEARAAEVPLLGADLRWRGSHRMYWENGIGPLKFDYNDVEPGVRWLGQDGLHTRFGDVAWMLASRDDRYVVTSSGEEIALSWDAEALPALPEGWRRDYVIFTDGWLKDANLNSLTGATVEPLPFTGMGGFPPTRENDDPEWRAFIEETLTRERSREEFIRALDVP